MSAKKSWDVERSPSPKKVPELETIAVVRARSATRSVSPSRRAKRVAPAIVHATRPRRAPISKEPLKVRRARAKRIFYIVISVLTVLGLGCLLYLAWLPALRISSVTAEGPDATEVVEIARTSLVGTHLWIVPRDSLLFIPESDIRKRILAAHPDIVAVSLKDSGLTGLHIVSVPRMSAFLWCGSSKEEPVEPCFDTDPDGLVFAPYTGDVPVASSTLHLRMYAPIDGEPGSPIGAHIKDTRAIPNALQLARAFKGMNANIAALALRGDEADFFTIGGTRVTYVIGRERQAAQLAASAFPKLHLNDGSIEYVDLRFDAKVFLRRTGAAVAE